MADPSRPSQLVGLYCPPGTGGCGLSETVRLSAGYHEFTFICPDCMHQTKIGVHVPAPAPYDASQLAIHAFGDESEHGDVIAYGLAVVPDNRLPIAEQFFAQLKRRYGVSSETEFHSKEVFHYDSRKATAWAHLSEAQTLEFADKLLSGLASASAGFIVGGVHRSEYPTELPAEGNFPAGEMGTKQLAGMACSAALLRLNEVYDQDRIRFYADPDYSKISFFGRKTQAHRLYQMTRSDTNQHIVPETFDANNERALLQVADLFAYTATHALADKQSRNKKWFERMYRTCGPTWSFMGSYHEFPPVPSVLESRHDAIMRGA